MTRKVKKKIKKLMNNPGIFFRDYFNKKYPAYTNEQKVQQDDEALVVDYELQLSYLESKVMNRVFPIDVVFTWVDNSDVEWQKKYNTANQKIRQDIGLYANDEARFESHNELYYSVHSVLTYLDWVHKIYIITDGQIPDWLKGYRGDKIIVIDHKDIIDRQNLPTFNSQVIEAHLHNIPNLSEHFIYFNDDVFVARPLPKEHFFASNGNTSLFISDKSLAEMKNKGIMTPTLYACMNCQALLNRDYQVSIDAPLVHSYIPLKKSYFQKAWQIYGNEIQNFLANKFRGNNDLNLATFLVPYLMYLNGESAVRREVCYYFNIRTNNAKVQYEKLLQKKELGQAPHSFCANDFHSNKQVPNFHENLENFLKRYFKID